MNGEKWFCSNVDAEAVLVTARPEGGESETRGLRTFLMLTRGNDSVVIERLKEKLGVRSMPTGEVMLRDAVAEELGDSRAMAEMLNLSRLYNAVASVAVIGRAVYEARWYAERRRAFGRAVVEHPLAQETLRDAQVLPIREGTTNIQVLDAIRAAQKERAHEPMLARIGGATAQTLSRELENLEERCARRWVDRLARAYHLALCAELGREDLVERLRTRPLGLIPGAGL